VVLLLALGVVAIAIRCAARFVSDRVVARWADAILRGLGAMRSDDDAPHASLEIETLGSERGFRLSGALDICSADVLREALEPELHGTLVLDLSAVEFIDDSGLGILLRAHRRLSDRGGSLVVRNPRGPVLRVFGVTGLAGVLGLAGSEGGTVAVGARVAPSYTLSLLVRLEPTGRLAPSVQFRGRGELVEPWIRLELVDREGRLRHVARERFPASAIGTEFSLPAFDAPDGASAAWALGWHWDVVIKDREGERARWREHPRPAGVLNVEAELAGTAERRAGARGRWYWIDGPARYAPGGEFEIHCRECAYSMWITPAPQVRENFPPPQSCPRCDHRDQVNWRLPI
jgi:anti-sigma B factor antagonist